MIKDINFEKQKKIFNILLNYFVWPILYFLNALFLLL